MIRVSIVSLSSPISVSLFLPPLCLRTLSLTYSFYIYMSYLSLFPCKIESLQVTVKAEEVD